MTEHKLTLIEILNFRVSGYKLASYFVRSSNEGGGVMIMVINNIECRPIGNTDKTLQLLNIDKIFESCAVQIRINSSSIVVGGIYRTPSRNVDDFLVNLDKFLAYLTKKSSSICIGGDFNIDVLTQDARKRDFINVLLSHNMYYTIDIPTRVTDSSETAIDNFITNIERKNFHVMCLVTALSDHDGQMFTLKNFSKINKSHTVKLVEFKRIYNKTNINKFLYDLKKENWSNLYNNTIENKFSFFYSILKYHFDVNFPLVKTRTRPLQKYWIDEEIKQERLNLVTTTKILRKNKNQKVKLIIKQHKKNYKNLILTKKRNYFNNKISNCVNVTKTAWQLVNAELGRVCNHSLQQIVLKDSNKVVRNQNKVANLFNNYYAEMVDNYIMPKLTNSEKSSNSGKDPVTNKIFKFKTISENQLIQIIDSLKNKWSSGYDGIPTKLIKEAKYLLLKPLLHVINACLISGVYPIELKTSKIIPLFKKGDPKNVSNYRPLAIQPSLSKIFEKCILNQLVDYFEVNKLLDNEQHGFRKNKSTITAIISFIENIIDKLENGEHIIATFLDMSKAFDSVSHFLLIKKLSTYGLAGKDLNLIKSYLEDRQQYVELRHVFGRRVLTINSKSKKVKYSVPQGSVLGPFLFLCYLGGLPNSISGLGSDNRLCMFADDINLTISGKNYDDVLADSLIATNKLSSQLNYRNLLLNKDKTKYMKFSCRDRTKLSEFDDLFSFSPDFSNETSFLGMVVDCHLNWSSHIMQVCSRMSSGIFALKRLSPFCNLATIKSTYFSLIHSHIVYGLEVYGATSILNLNKILHLQKVAIRTMLKLERNTHCKKHFSELNIMTVYSLYIYKTILFVKNNEKILPRQKDVHNYNTRNKQNFQLAKHAKKIFEKNPSYAGIKFLNQLPNTIKSENTYNTFKKKLKCYFIDKALYSIQEYFVN